MREESPPLEDTFPTLGTLTLLRRKTGEVAQTFPIDAERITFGRDYDCDVRLYLQDVSKIHAEIQFDLDTGAATLSVLGTNGVIHTPAGCKGVQLKAPSQVTLADGDTFAIRKKLFRFTYGESQEAPAYMSPMVQRTMPATPAKEMAPTPSRRRASMRLSIVPEGKRFVPSPVKPRATPSKTPAKSSLSKHVELESPQEFDELLSVEEGDEGDKLFLERKDDEDIKPVYHNPFMTPQPKSKIQMRNTSAVPRTRKLQFDLPPEGSVGEEETQFDDAPEGPITPSSIPLPPPSDTPYSLPMTPVRLPVPSISAQLAYSVPRGPVSLHKSVVIRNGWRAELDSKPKQGGVDEEIANGHIETRRRRSSSGLSSGRKSLSPQLSDSEPSSDSGSEASDDDKENTPASPASLQWVYENGMEETSQLDDSDSDGGSLDFDSSIPGQGMIDFDEEPVGLESFSDSEEDEEVSDSEEIAPEDEVHDISSDVDDEVDSSNVVDPDSLERERSVSPILPARLYTSPTQPGLGSPRLSLSSIGGPAVRFTPKASPMPTYGRGFPMTPTGRLGAPSRAEQTPVPVGEDDIETDEEEEEPVLLVPATPKTPRLPNGGLSRSQREALGTPRDLPAPPLSFRNPAPTPVKAETTSLHHIFEPSAPEEALSSEPPRTPFEDIKRRLSALRLGAQTSAKKRQSESLPRRATVGFALPETPSRETTTSRALASARRPVPATPRVDAIEEGESESLPATPTAGDAEAPALISGSDDTTPKHKRRRSLVSPSFAGLRDLLKTPKDPKTPSMTGVRSMFKTPKAITSPKLEGVRDLYREPRHGRSPSFQGLRNLLKEPEERSSPSLTGVKEMFKEDKVPATPAMSGMREMFAQKEVPPTPAFDGVAELYEESEEEQVEAEIEDEVEVEQKEQVEEPEVVTQPSEADDSTQPSQPSSPERSAPRTRSRLPTRTTRTVSAPTRRAQPTPADEAAPKPAKTTRTRKPAPEAVSEPVRRSTRARSKAPATSEDEPTLSAPARRTRTTRSATAEVEETKPEAKSEPVRRSRRVLGEAEQPKTRRTRVEKSEGAGKENTAEVEEVNEKPGRKAKPTTAAKKSAIAVSARATRSRKA